MATLYSFIPTPSSRTVSLEMSMLLNSQRISKSMVEGKESTGHQQFLAPLRVGKVGKVRRTSTGLFQVKEPALRCFGNVMVILVM